MPLYNRLRRRLGFDTTTEVTETRNAKRYTVTHQNGETSEILAHGYSTSGAFARFYVYDRVYVNNLVGYYLVPLETRTRVLSGIQEIESDVVGETTFRAVVDRADDSVVSKEIDGSLPVEGVVT